MNGQLTTQENIKNKIADDQRKQVLERKEKELKVIEDQKSQHITLKRKLDK